MNTRHEKALKTFFSNSPIPIVNLILVGDRKEINQFVTDLEGRYQVEVNNNEMVARAEGICPFLIWDWEYKHPTTAICITAPTIIISFDDRPDVIEKINGFMHNLLYHIRFDSNQNGADCIRSIEQLILNPLSLFKIERLNQINKDIVELNEPNKLIINANESFNPVSEIGRCNLVGPINIPLDLWLLIFNFHSDTPQELAVLSKACKYFYCLSHHDSLWKKNLEILDPELTIPDSVKNLKFFFSQQVKTYQLLKKQLSEGERIYKDFYSNPKKGCYFNLHLIGIGYSPNIFSLYDSIKSLIYPGTVMFGDTIGPWKNFVFRLHLEVGTIHNNNYDVILIVPKNAQELRLTIKNKIAEHKDNTSLRFYCVCTEGNVNNHSIKQVANQFLIKTLDFKPDSITNILDAIADDLVVRQKADERFKRVF